MGDNVQCGWFSYNVLEVEYRSQLEDSTLSKRPSNMFIAIRIQATSSAGKPVSVPFLRLQSENDDWFPELDDAPGLKGWMGVMRTVDPGATETGWILFDAPPGNYGLKLSDGVLDDEKTAFVRVPLQFQSRVK
jgi:hypothetical protein